MIGREALDRLARARVAVFGLGGVGGSAAEALVRAGIGHLDLIDHDTVSVTNLNRQILATLSTVGMRKVDAAKERFLSIFPEVDLQLHPVFFDASTADSFDFTQYDYVVDAIDSVSSKLLLIKRAHDAGTPILSCMGTGNKLHPEAFEITDLFKTDGCPLARVMRKLCRDNGIRHVKVLYSKEQPVHAVCCDSDAPAGRHAPGSISFTPPVAGMILAGEVVRDLITQSQKTEPCNAQEDT
jgi:tRNA A37 threonylcarbamoyladenosine dehydratase